MRLSYNLRSEHTCDLSSRTRASHPTEISRDMSAPEKKRNYLPPWAEATLTACIAPKLGPPARCSQSQIGRRPPVHDFRSDGRLAGDARATAGGRSQRVGGGCARRKRFLREGGSSTNRGEMVSDATSERARQLSVEKRWSQEAPVDGPRPRRVCRQWGFCGRGIGVFVVAALGRVDPLRTLATGRVGGQALRFSAV